jgi:endonuclease YncB( thermonuclease family)
MPRRLRVWYAVAAAVVSAVVAATAPLCPATDAQGRPAWRVEMINDGDTITCLDTEGRRVRVRLVRIDAPELDQPKGRESRAALVAKLAGGIVRVEGDARDQHGRVLGTLRLDDRNLNREMVAEGWVRRGRRSDRRRVGRPPRTTRSLGRPATDAAATMAGTPPSPLRARFALIPRIPSPPFPATPPLV